MVRPHVFFHVAFAALAILGVSASASAAPVGGMGFETEREVIVPDRVFAPTGFDDNDNVQIVVAGMLPNTCYKVGDLTREIRKDSRTVVIRHEAIFHPKSWCLFSLVPYREVLNVGVLGAGTWNFVFEDAVGKVRNAGSLNVGVSPSASPDTYLYALVDDVQVQRAVVSPGDGAKTLAAPRIEVSGSLLNSCMKLKELRVIQNDPAVIEILPIAELENGPLCSEAVVPFQSSVELDASLKGEALIHVRSLNGQALNKMFKF